MLNVFLYLNKEEKWKQTTGQDEDENMNCLLYTSPSPRDTR